MKGKVLDIRAQLTDKITYKIILVITYNTYNNTCNTPLASFKLFNYYS